MDDRTREMYSSFTDMERVEALITYIDSVRDEMFILQQKLDYLQEETGLSVNEVEVLQRKELWTQEEVCKYFSVNERTLRRGAESGEWTKPIKIGGKIYYKLIDLKEMFKSKDGNLDNLNNYLKV
ncbi:MAG: helix-turn-helix domain-containing protein [Flavobacteriaceae bacterium]|nr:helix-turn-helix domain-containing protein [Flavobacteriaceae bacterium]